MLFFDKKNRNFALVFLNFSLFLFCFNNDTQAVVIDLGTSVTGINVQGFPFYTSLPLSIQGGNNLSKAEIKIDFGSFRVTNITPLHENVQAKFEQKDNFLFLTLIFKGNIPDGELVEIDIEKRKGQPADQNSGFRGEQDCEGFGLFIITNAQLLNRQNQSVIPKKLEPGGWYQTTDFAIRTQIQIVKSDGFTPVEDILVTLLEISPGLEILNAKQFTNEDGIADIDGSIYIKGTNCVLTLRLLVEPTEFSTVEFEPFEVVREMKVDPDPSKLFLPITVPLQSTSSVTGSKAYR